MRIDLLERCFKQAIETNARYIAVQIETRGSEGIETIINPRENFEAKLAYYKNAYTDDLVLKTYDGIRIVGYGYGDSLSEIERNFEKLEEFKMLGETVELMNSTNYKDRFKAEVYQLKIRRDKLKTMLVKYKNNQLDFTPTCSYELLHKQLVVMDNYLDILLERAKVENVEL